MRLSVIVVSNCFIVFATLFAPVGSVGDGDTRGIYKRGGSYCRGGSGVVVMTVITVVIVELIVVIAEVMILALVVVCSW